MQFTASTLAVILTALATTGVEASPSLEGRATSLCNQKNYGAVGYPWQHSSTPGSFCGKTKPSNSGAWKQIPLWDGGDVVRCSGASKSKLKVCNGGNPKASLPSTCNPPHKFPAGWGGLVTGTSPVSVKCTPATCSWGSLWNCFLPSAWRQSCQVVVNKPTTGPTPVKSSTSSVAVSSPAVSSAAASTPCASAVSTGSDAASSAAAGVPSTAVTSAAADTSSVAASTTSSAPATTTSTASVDPTQYPVCEMSYQVQYQNYTLVAPNGYWYGQTVGSATQDGSYMTYTLATSVDDCLAACDQIEGCVFVNTYYDTNETEEDLPKHAPGVLTCAMFSQCVGTDKNTNFGGQDDPNQIYQSNGYCKSGACSS